MRNPYSIRPYQHVLEPLFAYLMIAARQYEDKNFADWYNVGPDDCDCVSTWELANLFCDKWGDGARWVNHAGKDTLHEANFLKLDSTKLKTTFNWTPRLHIDEAVELTVAWTKAWLGNNAIPAKMDEQINAYRRDLL